MKKGMSGIMFDGERIEDAVEAAEKIGYDGIEIRTKPNHLPADTTKGRLREIKRMIEDSGLEVPCIACFTGEYLRRGDAECEKQLDELKRYVEFALELKCPTLRHWAGGKPSRFATEEDWQRAALWTGRAADYAAKYGINLALELHHMNLTDCVDASLAFLKRLGRKNVGLIHDAANLYQDGYDYGRGAIKKLKGHLLGVHVKDIVALVDDSNPQASQPYRGRRFANRLINQGGVDQYSIFGGLKDIGYDGYITVESGWISWLKPYEVAEYSFKEMSKIMEALGIE
ncbi:MAG: sugar phosphate isomerase/epimerase family protein [bacterium]